MGNMIPEFTPGGWGYISTDASDAAGVLMRANMRMMCPGFLFISGHGLSDT
jgi:hypothetical protein